MTTALGATARTRERPLPVAGSALAAVVVVVGWVAYRHWAFPHLVAQVVGWAFVADRGWLVNLVEAMLLCVPYAIALLVTARSPGRGSAAALLALATGTYLWGLYQLFSTYVWDDGRAGPTSIRVYTWAELLVVAVLVPLAWGVARRRGRAWVAGLVVAPVVAAVLRELQLHWVWWREHVALDLHSYHWTVVAMLYVAPFVLGALACWLVEVATRRTPEIESSA